MAQSIHVLIVDDSPLMLRVLTEILEQDPAIRVVGTATNGQMAIQMVEQTMPHVVIMDVRMPVMDGLATTEHLMAYCPTPILVLTATAQHDLDITFKMLGAGALDVVQKPVGGDPRALARQSSDLIRRVKLLSRVKVVRHLRGRKRSEEAGPVGASLRTSYEPAATAPKSNGPVRQAGAPPFPVIMIGASTGGPRAVSQILAELPANLPAAIVVVQHIAEGFSGGMAEWLGLNCRMPVVLGQEGMQLSPGTVYIAPDRNDFLIQSDGSIHLSKNLLLLQRPSIDVAMQAAAAVFGVRASGVLLTGMGRDGAYGMLAIKRAGGYTVAQDALTSAIFGMPRAAIELGAASEVLPLPQIARRICERALAREVSAK